MIGTVKINAPLIESSPDKVAVAFAGDILIAASLQGSGAAMLLRYVDDGRPEQLDGLVAGLRGLGVFALAPSAVPSGGFALLCSNAVLLCESDGTLAGRMAFPFYPVMPLVGSPLLDTEPSGRVAFAGARTTGRHGWAVYDAHTGSKVADGPCLGDPTGICFASSGRLVVTSQDRKACYVELWPLSDSGAGKPRTVRFPLIPAARNPVAVPWVGRIGVRLGHLRLFDPDTLRESDVPQDLPGPGEPLSAQWISADKRICGFAGEGFAHVFRVGPMTIPLNGRL